MKKNGVCKEGGGKGNVVERDAELVEEKKDLLAMNGSDSSEIFFSADEEADDNRLGDGSHNDSKNIEDDVKDVNKENKGVEVVNGDMLSNDNCGKEIKKEMKDEDEEERRKVIDQGGREKLERPSGCQTTGEKEIIEEVIQSGKRKVSEVYTTRRVLRSDARREKEALIHEKEYVQSQSEKKRSGEPSDAEVPLKRIKSVPPNFWEGKAEEVDRKSKMERNDNVKGEIKMESHRGSRVLNHDRKKSSKLSEDQIESTSNQTSNMQAGKLKRKKLSCDHKCGMLKDESSLDANGDDDADVLEQTSHVRKAQSSVSHAKGRDKEKSNISQSPVSPRIATRSALKHSPFSEGKNFHNRFGLNDIPGRNQAMGKSLLSNKVKSRLKTKVKTLSPRKGLEKIDVSDVETDCEGRNHISSNPKASVMMKHRTNEKSGAISTAKNELREKIKGILLGAGWKIDLRPRRGRMYLDSVYIPPEGKGSYWSITKAYAVYQDKLENIYTYKSKTSEASCKRSEDNDCNFDAGSSSSIIPMESLNMLKRITVKKRAKKELGDAKKGKRKKKKDFLKEIHLKKTKVGKIRRMKRTYETLGSNTINASASKVRQRLQTRRSKQKGCALLARGANQEADLDNDNHVLYSGKRTMLSWMIDLGVVSENGKVKYMNNRGTKSKLEGWIKNDGIYCSCCSEILTIGDFENHAGSKLKQASQNIFVEEPGISLLQCQINAWEKQSESERKGFYAIDISDDDPNDDTCGICGDGGDLICCDGCPSTFHLSCLGIQMLPSGDWNCTNCSCKFCGTVSASRESDESLSSPLLSCSQCEEKYHQACVPESDSFSLGSSSSDLSFCGQSCRKAFRKLQKLLGAKNAMEDGFTWSLIRRFDDDNSRSPVRLSQRVECNSKIALAFAVMNECFLPINDRRSGINLIHNVVYNCGSNFDRLNYEGFYVFILERGDEIISAASVRIHGTRLAEMPFIGTRHMYRRQGMCRRLLDGIETALCSLNVEKLVIPAISEMKNTWTTVFGFKPLEPSQELEIRSIKFLVFPGTGLLQKPLLKKCPIEPYVATNGVAPVECNMEHHNEAAHGSSAAEDDTHILMLGQTKEESGCVALPSATKECHVAPQESLESSKDLPARAESIISSNSSDTPNRCLQVANDLDKCEELPSGLNEIPTQQISPRDSGTKNFRHQCEELPSEIAIDTRILGDEGSLESIPPCSVSGAANCGSELVKEMDKGSDYTSETANVSIL